PPTSAIVSARTGPARQKAATSAPTTFDLRCSSAKQRIAAKHEPSTFDLSFISPPVSESGLPVWESSPVPAAKAAQPEGSSVLSPLFPALGSARALPARPRARRAPPPHRRPRRGWKPP